MHNQEVGSAGCGSKQHIATEVERHESGQIGRRAVFARRARVFAAREPAATVYRLIEGSAVRYKIKGDGRRQVVGFALPGDFLASPFFDDHQYSVETISEAVVREFSRRQFLISLESSPTRLWQMLEATLHDTDAERERIMLLGCCSAEERFVEFIIDWRARIGRKGALANLVPLPMTRREVADYLGLTIETVSRLLSKLETENVLRVAPEGLQLLGSAEQPVLLERSCRLRD